MPRRIRRREGLQEEESDGANTTKRQNTSSSYDIMRKAFKHIFAAHLRKWEDASNVN